MSDETDDTTTDVTPTETVVTTAEAPAVADAPASVDAPDTGRAARKVREGQVVSTKMDKTVVVAVVERVRHPRYAKTVQRTTRLYAHSEIADVKVGDRVRVMETRPMSKLKRWRLSEVLERAK